MGIYVICEGLLSSSFSPSYPHQSDSKQHMEIQVENAFHPVTQSCEPVRLTDALPENMGL